MNLIWILNNQNLSYLRIGILTLTISVSIVILLLYFFNIKSNFGKIIILTLFCNENNQLALTNSLFIIHPILLYFSFIMFIIKLQFNPLLYIYLSIIAICLGGVWATQELNWGGWWNWDLIELSCILLLLLFLKSIHINYKRCLNNLNMWRTGIILWSIIIYSFNKLGLGNSIHSFTLSQNLINYYIIALLLFYINILIFNSFFLKQILPLTLIIYTYIFLINISILKYLIVIGIINTSNNNNILKLWHKILYLFLYLILIINFRLIGSVETHTTQIIHKLFQFNNLYSFKINIYLTIFKNSFLFKPLIFFYGNLQVKLSTYTLGFK